MNVRRVVVPILVVACLACVGCGAAQEKSSTSERAMPNKPPEETALRDTIAGKEDNDIADLTESIRLDPKNGTLYNNRGTTWLLKQDYDKAIRDYDEAIRLDPTMAFAFYNRGNAWDKKKNYDKAIRDFDETIRLNPTFPVAFNDRGAAWHHKHNYDKAIRDYDEAIRLDPKYADAFNNRGLSWHAKRDHDKAIRDYDEAIRLNPKYVWALYNRGTAWFDKQDYDKAIRDYDEALRLDPKHARALFNRTMAQFLTQRPEAVVGFQALIDVVGWKSERAIYSVIRGHFAARWAGDDARAHRFLSDSAGKLEDAWPNPVVQFLRGEVNEGYLLKWATENDIRTEARCYIGLDHALKGRKDAALAHFRWIKEHGNVSCIEYSIAVAELKRLETSAPSKR